MNAKRKKTAISLVHLALVFVCWTTVSARADSETSDDSSKTEPDVLVFVDGEKLIGHLERATGASVIFKSDMAGEITTDWGKIKELHSGGNFAIVEKGTRLGWHENISSIPQGRLSVADQEATINPGKQKAPVTVPVVDITDVIDASTFQKAVQERPDIFQDWKGFATVGISLVTATQDNRTYTSSVSLERALPTEAWMDPSNRTILGFTSTYGEISQPGTPTVKTSLFRANGERDQYFSPRVFVFANAGFDHDYSQGLDLQESYGGGVGWTALKRANEELDLRGELDYIDQQFSSSAQNQKLLGSIFSERYNRKFKHNLLFNELLAISPAWTNLNAYSANGTISLSMPVIKRISITSSTTDSFLNNPSPGFRKNSFQFTTGLTYTLP